MKTIRTREIVSSLPTPDYLKAKEKDGWRLVSLVWEREVAEQEPVVSSSTEPVPYGLRVCAEVDGLVENPEEMEALSDLLDLVVGDRTLSQIVEAFNARGYRTRQGSLWTESEIFKLLPRLIEATPTIFQKPAWTSQKHYHGPPPS